MFTKLIFRQFEASDAAGHSSSIVDLFDSMRSPIDFLKGLEWVDEYQEARFFMALAKVEYSHFHLRKFVLMLYADYQQSN